MPYIKRNQHNQIVAVSHFSEDETYEFVDAGNRELTAYLNALTAQRASDLERLDNEVARIFEDLVDILIDKGVIQFTDLPKPAQEKLIKRQNLRKKVSECGFVADHDDDSIRFE
jgi:hypothetical protein